MGELHCSPTGSVWVTVPLVPCEPVAAWGLTSDTIPERTDGPRAWLCAPAPCENTWSIVATTFVTSGQPMNAAKRSAACILENAGAVEMTRPDEDVPVPLAHCGDAGQDRWRLKHGRGCGDTRRAADCGVTAHNRSGLGTASTAHSRRQCGQPVGGNGYDIEAVDDIVTVRIAPDSAGVQPVSGDKRYVEPVYRAVLIHVAWEYVE